jgi:hypothetical protein
MKRAMLLVLVLMSGSLAGCLAGDENSGVQVQLTDEQIDAILEDYFQDFVNNTTVTINDQTNSNSTTNVYQNGTASSQVEYFVIDYQFTKGDLFGADEEIDYMNNTFVATQSVYNYSTDNTTYYEYTLLCEGYYLVGMATTPVPYWQTNNTGNYWTAWTSEYNETIAQLYQDYAYNADVRTTCDPSYNSTSGVNTELLTLYELEVPAGKALNCMTAPDLRMFNENFGFYHPTIYGVLPEGTSSHPTDPYRYRYSSTGSSSLTQVWDDWGYPYCTNSFYGNPNHDTTFAFSAPAYLFDYGFQYRFYMVYALTDVSAHVP